MSLEKDITEIQKDLFRPASKKEIVARQALKKEMMKKENPAGYAAIDAVNNFKPEEHKYSKAAENPYDNYSVFKSPNEEMSDGFAIVAELENYEPNAKWIFRAKAGGGRTFTVLDFNKVNVQYGGFIGNTPEEAYNQYIAAFKKFEATLRELGMLK